MAIVNEEQAEHWNGEDAAHWVNLQDRYDEMLEGFIAPILDAAALTPSDAVLDVGCGCGATTRAAARLVPDGHAVGADLSAPMLDRGRADAAAAGLTNLTFEQADAQVHPFDDDSFDAVISRFGVMFFEDPTAAFANLRRATRAGGRLSFICWQAISANEWFGLPVMALATVVGPPEGPPPVEGAPGPFSLADAEHVRTILNEAGWRGAAVDSLTVPVLLGGRGGVETAVDFVRSGRAGRPMLAGRDPETTKRALDAVRDALAPHLTPDGVRFDANVWLVTAQA
jgi:SAM-dependent methyltransferase